MGLTSVDLETNALVSENLTVKSIVFMVTTRSSQVPLTEFLPLLISCVKMLDIIVLGDVRKCGDKANYL